MFVFTLQISQRMCTKLIYLGKVGLKVTCTFYFSLILKIVVRHASIGAPMWFS